jgi:L-lactate dehydrogenase complex protein LldE
MRVSLFIPCFVNQYFPEAGIGMVRVIERLGHSVDYPKGQTCCGQPAFNSGYWEEARPLASRMLDLFEASDVVVSASGSCGAMLKVFTPKLFANTDREAPAQELALKTYEFSEFLVNHLGVTDVGARYSARATFHDGCHGLRELGIKEAPRQLLRAVDGLELIEMNHAEECCGFGGTFAVKFPHISTSMGEVKCSSIRDTEADVVVSNDSSCLMHIDGLLRKQGRPVPTKHLAEILAQT